MKLHGKTVLITGAGSGIGRAAALVFARKGARLVLMGRRAEPLESTAALVRHQPDALSSDGDALVVVGDVTNAEERERALEQSVRRFGTLDVLVNNAGAVRAGRLDDITEAEIRAMVEVDLVAPILMTKAALPALRRSGDAAVVHVSSGLALVGAPFYSTYAATKAGLGRFGEALRRELLDEGVHVMTIYPAATDTPMMATNKAGPELGFTRETADKVAEALVEGLERKALEVIRGGETRAAMIATNREHPEALDERFRGLKPQLLAAVAGHSAM